jgi:hypothetical protein
MEKSGVKFKILKCSKQTLSPFPQQSTLILTVIFPDVSQMLDIDKKPLICHMLHKWLCPCLKSPFQKNIFTKTQVMIIMIYGSILPPSGNNWAAIVG